MSLSDEKPYVQVQVQRLKFKSKLDDWISSKIRFSNPAPLREVSNRLDTINLAKFGAFFALFGPFRATFGIEFRFKIFLLGPTYIDNQL